MSKARIPYFDFYPADFMHGIRGLTAQEVGIYTMLLCRIYEENGPVEYHPARLSTYCGTREATFVKAFDRLVVLGKLVVEGGRFMNPRARSEISAREVKLENNSRAGKISANKRKQKQQEAATDVQHPCNHTDTDTDTDKAATAAPVATSADADATGSKRERILAAMGLGPDGVKPDGRFIATSTHMAEVPKWDALGLTEAEQIAVIRDNIAKRQAAVPGWLPNSLSYFTAAMAELAAAKVRGVSIPSSPAGPSAAEQRRRRWANL